MSLLRDEQKLNMTEKFFEIYMLGIKTQETGTERDLRRSENQNVVETAKN